MHLMSNNKKDFLNNLLEKFWLKGVVGKFPTKKKIEK
jgi:hypothetical protein